MREITLYEITCFYAVVVFSARYYADCDNYDDAVGILQQVTAERLGIL